MISILIVVLLFGVSLFGLVLLATGIILLLKQKNKLAGGLALAIGAIFTASPILIFLAVTVIQRVQS